MNQSVSVRNSAFRFYYCHFEFYYCRFEFYYCHFERSEKSSSFLTALYLPDKKRCTSAASVFSFRYAGYAPGKGVKDWLMISFLLFYIVIFFCYSNIRKNISVERTELFNLQ